MSAPDRKAPNWKGWALLDFVKGWEAVALSMDIDPRSMKIQLSSLPSYDPYHYSFEKSSFRNRQEHDDFRWRLRLLGTAFAREQSDRVASWNTGEVSLAEFAAWCVENELDVSPEFAILGKGADSTARSSPTTPRQTPAGPPEDCQAMYVGVNRDAIITAFEVKRNEDENFQWWDDRLSRPGKWLEGALIQVGKPGRSSRWSPESVAFALLEKGEMNLRNLDAAMRRSFSDRFENWEALSADWRKTPTA
jgi:hypothetical protein